MWASAPEYREAGKEATVVVQAGGGRGVDGLAAFLTSALRPRDEDEQAQTGKNVRAFSGFSFAQPGWLPR